MRGMDNFIGEKRKENPKPKMRIIHANKNNKMMSDFLLAYILPMIAFKFTTVEGIIQFIVYFFVLAFLCIRNNNIYTNIYLEFKKYRIYICDIEHEIMGKNYTYYDSFLICKKDLTLEEENCIEYYDFDNYTYLIFGEEG